MIEFQHIHKSFGSQKVLCGIDLNIPDGSRYCVVGPSGTGKSVLMKLLLGLEIPDKGTVYINGQNTRHFTELDWRACLEDFGVVFQGGALFDSLEVWENVGLKLLEEKRFPVPLIKEKVAQALGKVGLGKDILLKMPGSLSGGMRKRVGIARAIIDTPAYLIYDEPSTGLDPVSAGVIDDLILSLAETQGHTAIIITHDMHTVKTVATDVAMLYNTQLIFNDKVEEFLRSELPEIQSFLNRG